VVSETHDPVIARLTRCIDGRRGRRLLAAQGRASNDRLHPTPHRAGEDAAGTAKRLGLPWQSGHP
jgi:type IV secretion system protein VirD4